MSRQPSPGPSHPPSHPPFHPTQPSARQRPKPYATGIAAGAEDAKYKTKYRELKKKVKEIEADNDKLLFKMLQAKRNISRMKIERAVLYERLSGHPSPQSTFERQGAVMHDAQLHPSASHVTRGHRSPREVLETQLIPVDPNNHAAVEYYRNAGIPIRIIQGPDGQPVHVAETVVGPAHMSRHSSGHTPSRDARQHNVHAPSASSSVQHLEPPHHRGQQRSVSHHNSHSHSPSASSHSRSRSRGNHASQVSHAAMTAYPQQAPLETFPPSHHDSQPPAPSSDRGRSSRDEAHELATPHSYAHVQSPPMAPGQISPTAKGSSRIHNHQRMGPGTNINNIGQPERERDRDVRDREREIEWEQERSQRTREMDGVSGPGSVAPSRVPSPPFGARYRPAGDAYAEERDRPSRMYEPRGPRDSAVQHGASRSATPRSRSGSIAPRGSVEDPSRPSSRSQYYPREYEQRPRPSVSHLVHPPDVDTDMAAEDARHSRPDSSGRISDVYTNSDSRKRSRSDVEGDLEMDDGSPRRPEATAGAGAE